MIKIRFCPECGVPEQVTGQYRWLNSGVIVQSTDMTRRVGFIESENLDPVYKGIGEIIGVCIDRLVTDGVRKGTLEYIRNIIPPGVRDMIQKGLTPIEGIIEVLIVNAHLNGFGKFELVDFLYNKDDDDFETVHVTDPFSVPLCAGVHAGACEAVTDRSNEVIYSETFPGVYEFTAFICEHAGELAERLHTKGYHHKEGGVYLERCQTCGGPKALSRFKWDLEIGKITNTLTNKRMVLIGPEVQDPLFEELEKELGGTIPGIVVEAQRRFVKWGFFSMPEVGDHGELRNQLALRGLGDLREIKMGAHSLSMRVNCAANHLITVGMAQGYFERAFDTGSRVEWELSGDGDLLVEATPQRITAAVTI